MLGIRCWNRLIKTEENANQGVGWGGNEGEGDEDNDEVSDAEEEEGAKVKVNKPERRLLREKYSHTWSATSPSDRGVNTA